MVRSTRGRFQKKIFSVQRAHGRGTLPWRNTRDPYRIFVSEIMLQQTQVSRVLPKAKNWFGFFPGGGARGPAPFPNVLHAWQGLGYTRRARYLADSARLVIEKYSGLLPDSPDKLEKLPGIGRSSARAVACFAFGKCEPFIETNIRRAIIHEFFPSSEKNIADEKILEILELLEPRTRKKDWYFALMDYGAGLKRHFPNPNQRGKSYVRQTRFEGSTRYGRAAIVKTLLAKKRLSEQELLGALRSNPSIMPHIKSGKWKEILTALEKDGILVYNNSQWKIAENESRPLFPGKRKQKNRVIKSEVNI